MVIDKSKTKPEIMEFNSYIFRQLEEGLILKYLLTLITFHRKRRSFTGNRLICLGIFRKYERKDQIWYDVFKNKVLYDEQYL